MDDLKERLGSSRTVQVTYSGTGELIASPHGFVDTNPSPDASASPVPTGASRRVFFDITRR